MDAAGGPVFDPSRNVLDLVEAAIRRQDDLRESESSHIRELIAVRSQYEQQLREIESRRLDAIRLVDTGQVQRAAEVQAAAQAVLATQVQTTAEAIRLQVAAAYQAQTEFVNKVVEPLAAAVAAVQKVQYEQAGVRQQVVETRDVSTDRRGGTSNLLAGASVAIAVVSVLALVILALVK